MILRKIVLKSLESLFSKTIFLKIILEFFYFKKIILRRFSFENHLRMILF